MEIRPIKTKADHRAALKEIEALMAAERNTPEGERLDVLATLVEAYERARYPLEFPDPIEAIKFRMEQQGLSPKDLVPMIGRINRVYEVLSRKRPLTLAMIQRLHGDLGIPAESLIRQPEGRTADRRRSRSRVVTQPHTPTIGAGRKAVLDALVTVVRGVDREALRKRIASKQPQGTVEKNADRNVAARKRTRA